MTMGPLAPTPRLLCRSWTRRGSQPWRPNSSPRCAVFLFHCIALNLANSSPRCFVFLYHCIALNLANVAPSLVPQYLNFPRHMFLIVMHLQLPGALSPVYKYLNILRTAFKRNFLFCGPMWSQVSPVVSLSGAATQLLLAYYQVTVQRRHAAPARVLPGTVSATKS